MSQVRLKSALVLIIVGLQYGCVWGRTDEVLSVDPISFVDAETGAVLSEVLVIPKYSSSSGVSTGAGHGPGAMKTSRFFANPMLYRHGSPFDVEPPESKGIVVGPALFAGQSMRLNGVVIIANGYRSTWLWRTPTDSVEMQPLDRSQAADQQERFRLLFQQESVDGAELSDSERRAFSTTDDLVIEFRFREDDRKLVDEYLQQAADR